MQEGFSERWMRQQPGLGPLIMRLQILCAHGRTAVLAPPVALFSCICSAPAAGLRR